MVALLRPQSLAEACAMAREHGESAKYVSGGTALVLLLGAGLVAADRLISLSGLQTAGDCPDWTMIRIDGDTLVIGGGVTLAAVSRSPLVRERADSLAHAAGVVGNVRIRNIATLGGNLAEADYASDPPSVLVSLDATLVVHGPEGPRQIPAADMFLDFFTTALTEGEVITAVRIPTGRVSSNYLKFCSRSAEDRPCVGVASSLRLSEDGTVVTLNVAVGAVSAIPQRLPDVLEKHVGGPWRPELAEAIAEGYARGITPMSDVRGSADYRTRLIRVLVRRSLETVAEAERRRHG